MPSKKKKNKKAEDGVPAGSDGEQPEGSEGVEEPQSPGSSPKALSGPIMPTEQAADKPAEEGDKKPEALSDMLNFFKKERRCADSRKNPEEKKHEFWDTQPVRKFKETIDDETGPIDELKTPADVRQDPYPLPGSFEWVDCDIGDETEANEIYQLLSENYVEDDDGMFRFEYSSAFLQWALQAPEYHKNWHIGVRVKGGTRKLVAFISGIPQVMNVQGDDINTAEINFLCVHKKLRSKRLAPLLIKEVTRRVNLRNVWQAVYTAGVVLPRPVAECRYYHRSLNPKKLIEVGFSHLAPRMTLARTIKLYKLPDENPPGMREMKEKDVPRIHQMLSLYLKKFSLKPVFTEEEIKHWILPRDGVVYCYVNVDANDEPTDFCSFYCLPSTILGHDKYTSLKAAYSFWNVAETRPLVDLMKDMITWAKLNDFDVCNALNIMDNSEFLKDLKFGVGDGFLQYYLFNWKCPKLEAPQVGLVLL